MTKKVLTLAQKIAEKKAVVGILGLGYVGLPLAREFATSGIKVIGFDIDDKKIRRLNSGRSIIKGVPDAIVGKMVADKKFSATTNMSQMKNADAILICVPTPLMFWFWMRPATVSTRSSDRLRFGLMSPSAMGQRRHTPPAR